MRGGGVYDIILHMNKIALFPLVHALPYLRGSGTLRVIRTGFPGTSTIFH